MILHRKKKRNNQEAKGVFFGVTRVYEERFLKWRERVTK